MTALTLVQALPGAGKTHLVGSWAKGLWNTGTIVEWIDARAEMNSPGVLLAHVYRALNRATDDDDAGLIVVIDNADCIDDPAAIDQLLTLLTRLPGLHLVVCSRFTHPIRAAAEQQRVDLHVLTGRDLALTADELSQFATSRGHVLSARQLGELHDLTGGWLQLTRLILDDTSAESEHFSLGSAERYLRTLVMPQVVNEAETDIAFRLAVPRMITEALVTMLLGTSAGQSETESAPAEWSSPDDVIDLFDALGLLKRVGADVGAGATWRIPTVIRTVLLDEFGIRSPLAAAETHRLLSTFYAATDPVDLGAALTHARAGEDWAFLNQVVYEQAFKLMLIDSNALIAAFSSLPDAVLLRYPSLNVAATMADTFASDPEHDNGRPLLRSYLSAAEGKLADLSAFDSMAELSAVAVAEVISRRSAGLLDSAMDLARGIDFEIARRRGGTDAGGSSEQVAWFRFQWAMTALLAGDIELCTQLSFDAFEVAREEGNDLVASNAAAQLALIHALGGEEAGALRWLRRHHGFETHGTVTDYLIGVPARVAQAYRALDELDSEAATAQLLAAGDAAQELEMWAFIAEADARHALLFAEPIAMLARLGHLTVVHARVLAGGGHAHRAVEKAQIDLLLAMGELNQASQRLTDAERGDQSRAAQQLGVQRARLQLIAGNYERAQKIASAGIWNAATTLRDQIDLLMIAAVAQLAVGEHPAAAKSFTRAHALATHARTLAPYALIPAEDREALLQLSNIELTADAQVRIAQMRPVYPRRAQLIVLTKREEAVLAELVKTDSFAAIAAALTVSMNTVKKQAASIYSKLGVHDRMAALSSAHQLGLLGATGSS
ncbi:hypothetical protein GCM10022381_18720 [Leifsonia kafniensis]|uniref:HTH luxR-type domain-containing protein n=1 Tax=Leifsonia kafniensis TaxID=475957 RepID=A0ABP7KG02_9MICO